ncbi:lysine exporter LysO family protein [Thermococcus argininiproducens]|uniref:Lysine exporter LysO family protein n=1 Tax=Thermococcus argininiproducens TaxID=2866384 RepID=A0A9E7M9B1_9EURY|nr:lysine exporter LysO family protein [Thermococcus argininiproducens]USG99091.1 lysine exporter LysO family protein [Thermococcus argininiproducens]
MNFLYFVLASLILGITLGKTTTFDFGNLYEIMLYLLIFIIGMDIGKSKGLREELKKLGRMALLLPMATVIGSLLGGFLASLLLGIPLKWALGISAGFGWYSLTGPLLAAYSPIYGVIGFLANLTREILTIIFYPVVIRKIPREVGIVMGGATTMDTTLPIMAKFGGTEITLLAFVHGFILTAIAPFLIPLILQIL